MLSHRRVHLALQFQCQTIQETKRYSDESRAIFKNDSITLKKLNLKAKIWLRVDELDEKHLINDMNESRRWRRVSKHSRMISRTRLGSKLKQPVKTIQNL